MTRTGIVVEYDQKRHAVAVIVNEQNNEHLFKVQVEKPTVAGEEIKFDTKKVLYEYTSSAGVTLI